MSFSRAPLKRFNENHGCAPAPGSYDVKDEGHKGPAAFLKSERFKTVKPACADGLPPPSPIKNFAMPSPVRRTISVDGLVDLSVKKDKPGFILELKRQQLLEKEIRSLVQQRGEQDKRLLVLQEELKRLEAKLLSAVRDRTSLSASAKTLERQLAELRKANEFLKTKVSADTTKKRINSLTMELMDAKNSLDLKNKETCLLQVNTASQVKVLEQDLQAANTTVTTLTERNKDLEDLQQEIKTQNEELSTETETLHDVIRGLKGEIKALQEYLDTANDQIQDLRVKIREKTASEHSASESQRNTTGRLEGDLLLSQEALRQKEEESQKYQEELLASQQSLQDAEQRMESCESELSVSRTELADIKTQIGQANEQTEECRGAMRQQEAELGRLREVLRSTEQELDERMAHLSGRCLTYEEEKSKMQEEGMRKVELLKAELTSLNEVHREEERKAIALQQAHTTLSEELEKEKALVDSLSVLLEHEREESEVQRAQLKEEMEEVLGELALMEEQESRRQEEMDGSLQRLQQENQDLVQQLSQASASLDRTSTEAALLKESHLTAMARLEEEQARSLSNLGDIATEMESRHRTELLGLQTRLGSLEEETGLLRSQVAALERDGSAHRERLTSAERDKEQLLAQLEGSQREESSSLRSAEEDRAALMEELEAERRDRRALQEQVELFAQEKVTLQWEIAEQNQEFQRQLAEAQAKSSSSSEAERWKKQYEDLYSTIKPFREQLNSFAAERDALLNENGVNQDELNRLADAYARLLGHQNQKQKIKHVIKLKEENNTLRQEVSKLRSQVSRQKSDLDHLKQPKAQQRRFDPSQAFQRDGGKENLQPDAPASGLRKGEDKAYL